MSHDIVFVKHVATKIIAMKPPGIELCYGGYDYYCEKEAARESTIKPVVKPEISDRKLERRRRAEAVQELSRRRTHIKKNVQLEEKRIHDLEKEQAELTAQLEGRDIRIDYAAINRRLTEIRDQLEQTTKLWEQTATEFERLSQPKEEKEY